MFKWILSIFLWQYPLFLCAQFFSATGDTITICGSGVGAVGVKVKGGTEPFEYFWNVAQTEAIITPYVANTSNFQVTVRDANGQEVIAVARINVNTAPTATFLQPAPVWCAGQYTELQMRLEGAFPLTLEYSVNGILQPPITNISSNLFVFPIIKAGLYQIVGIRDANGCRGNSVSSIYIAESGLMATATVQDIKCDILEGGSIAVDVSGGVSPYQYTWIGPQNIEDIPNPTALKPGEYYLTVTDATGCQVMQEFNIEQPPPLIASISSTQSVTCVTGGSIDLSVSGGRPPYTYLWNNNLTIQDPQSIAAGTYSVTITDRSGCQVFATTEVGVNLVKPVASALVTDLLTCANKSIVIDGSGSDAGPGFIYRWEAEPGFIIEGITSLHPTVNQPGTYKLIVINQENGCSASVTARVIAEKNYPVSLPGKNQVVTCVVSNATLIAEGSSEGPDFSYHWSPPPSGVILGGITTLTPIVRGVGPYTLTVTNNTNGCSSTASVTVTGDLDTPVANIDAPGSLSCTVTNIPLNAINSLPKDSLTFYWTTANGTFLSNPIGPKVSVGNAGEYTLVVTDIRNGCTASKSVNVQRIVDNLSVSVQSSGNLNCTNATVTLDGSKTFIASGMKYVWDTDFGNFVSGQNTLKPVVNAPGRYTLNVTNPTNNCTISSSVVIARDIEAPKAVAGTPSNINCIRSAVLLGDPLVPRNARWRYSWTTAGGNILEGKDNPLSIVNAPGIYTLTVVDTVNKCTAATNITIGRDTVAPIVVIHAPDSFSCMNNAILLDGSASSTGALYKYQWQSSVPNGILSGEKSVTALAGAVGNYTLSITNSSNGCTAAASVEIKGQDNDTEIEIMNSGIITCKQQIVKLSANPVKGSNLRYQWFTLDGNILTNHEAQEIEVNRAGVYVVKAINLLSGCEVTKSVDVYADKIAPQANAGPDMTIDCKHTPISLDGSASNSGNNYAYQWSVSDVGNILSDKKMPIVQVNEAGNYQLIVTNIQNGCTATDNVLVSPDIQTPIATVKIPGSINCIQSEVILDASASSSGSDFVYNWSGPGVVSGDGTPLLTVNQPGIYTLSVKNTSGCSTSVMVEVKRDILRPPAEVGGRNMVLNCRFPQRALEPVTAATYTYFWDGPGIISGIQTASPIVNKEGTYNVTVVNTANGCRTTDAVVVTTDFDTPAVDAGSTFQLTCFQNSYTIPASATMGPDITYSWSTVGGHIVSPTNLLQPVVDGAGRYFITVTNTRNGCSAESSVQIYQSASVPLALSGNPVVITCRNPAPILDGSGSSVGLGITYLWQAQPGGNIVSGANTMRPVVDKPGMYILTVTDTFNQCSSSSSLTVTADKFVPLIDAGPSVVLSCRQKSVSLNAYNNSNGLFSYRWRAPNGMIVSGDSTLSPKVSLPDQYFLTATNPQNGCTVTDSVLVVGDFTKPNAGIKIDNVLNCRNTTAVMHSELPAAAAADVYFSWFTPDGKFISTATNATATVNKPGNYYLAVTNKGNGCADTSLAVIGIDTLHPIADAGLSKKITCNSTTTQLNGSIAMPDSGYFYQWLTFNGNILLGGNTLSPVVNAGGIYTLLVQNPTNGCLATDKVVVEADMKAPKTTVIPPLSINCSTSQVLLDGSPSAQSPDILYKWATDGGHFAGDIDSAKVYVDAPGIYFLTSFDQTNGCFNSDTVLVSTNLVPPIVEAGIPFALTCTTLEEQLQAYASNGPAYTFNWSTNSGNILSGKNTMTPLINKAGTYYLKVTNINTGCENIDSVSIAIETERPDSFAVLLDSITCKVEQATLVFSNVKGGVGPYLYSIDGGSVFSPEIKYTDLKEGSYQLVVQDANGCEHDQTFEIPGSLKPSIQIVEEKLDARARDSIRIQANIPIDYPLSLIDTIIWTPPNDVFFSGSGINSRLNPLLVPQRSTTFAVKLVSLDGCIATDKVDINVDNTLYIFVANTFTPLAIHGNNSRVMVSAEDDRIVQIRQFKIFDRWGGLVFEAHNFQPNDPQYGWDGSVGGKYLTPGVYSWFLEADLISGETRLFQGDTALLR